MMIVIFITSFITCVVCCIGFGILSKMHTNDTLILYRREILNIINETRDLNDVINFVKFDKNVLFYGNKKV